MKHLIVLFLLATSPSIVLGQYSFGFMHEIFFVRQPSARAEAMGKGYCSIDGDLTTVFFNPAGIGSIKGLVFDGSYTSPYYSMSKANYNFFSIGYRINKHFSLGLSRNHFSYGEEFLHWNALSNTYELFMPRTSNIYLTFAYQPVKNLFFGLNANSIVWKPVKNTSSTAFYFDFGAIKKFEFLKRTESEQSVNIGLSITNFNFAKATLKAHTDIYKHNLPVITRYGVNYQFILDKHLFFDSLKTFKILLQGEYKMLLNSKYLSGYHVGAEVGFLELIYVRFGYFKEKLYNHGYPEYNKDELSSLTYGVGIQIPLDKLITVPFSIAFDYTSLPQPSYILYPLDLDNFSTYNLRINWIFDTKK